MDEKIIEQFNEIRNSGECNMFDANCVMQLANERGFYELINYCHPKGRLDLERYAEVTEAFGAWMESKDSS